VWLPDFKYSDNVLAARYSNVSDYIECTAAAILEMLRLVGNPKFDDDGLLTRGVLVRHLVLPNQLENTYGVLDWFADNLRGKGLLSLMCQFTPNGCPDFSHALTANEYRRAVDYMHLLGIRDGFVQEMDAAREGFVPPWTV
jgi:putative pyruvate formate lyase activating enzyme